jgi:hypothetical protein
VIRLSANKISSIRYSSFAIRFLDRKNLAKPPSCFEMLMLWTQRRSASCLSMSAIRNPLFAIDHQRATARLMMSQTRATEMLEILKS